MNKDLERFCENFHATVQQSPKYFARRVSPMFNRNLTGAEHYSYDYESYIEKEHYYEVTLPNNKLADLMSMSRHIDHLQQSRDKVDKILAQNTLDETVRRKNPAVQKAYEKYQMLLELSRK
jgi:hypothetical protein